MKNYKNYRLPPGYSLANAILDILIDLGEQAPLADSTFSRTKSAWRKFKGMPPLPRWRYNHAIVYLEKRKQIKVFEKNDKIFLKLTRKGKVRVLMQNLRRDFQAKPDWDGKWRLIMWDIPERSSKERDKIRRLVKNLDFYKLQHSVFITPHPLPKSAVGFLRESKLLNYIRFLKVDRFENDKFLKRHFKLR